MGGNLPVFQRFVKFLQGLWARLSWTGGAHYLSGGPRRKKTFWPGWPTVTPPPGMR